MKKSFLLVAFALLVGAIAANAQGGGNFPRRTVEERVQTIHEKMDSAFKLDKAKLTQVDSVFATYYRGTDKGKWWRSLHNAPANAGKDTAPDGLER
jgi:hypothetical protein